MVDPLLGMQSGVIEHESSWGLGREEQTLPQYLKKQGYTTRAVGKVCVVN